MKCGRFISSLALASALIGGALAQQAPTPAAAPAATVAKEYDQQFLVAGSWFHGVHGLAFNKDDQLFAVSVVAESLYKKQVDSG